MSTNSSDEPKFTSARKKEEKKEKIISKTPKLKVHNPPEQYDLTDRRQGKKEIT